MLRSDTRAALSEPLSAFRPQAARASNSGVDETRAFWRRVERYAPGVQVVATPVVAVALVVSGWGCEARVLPDGRRQIFSILLPGDAVFRPAEASLSSVAVVAVTRLEISQCADSAIDAGTGLIDALMRQCARLQDHVVRLGSLNAHERTVHLLLELHERLGMIGLVKDDTYRIPLTQEAFAEALGLSVVHINRTLGHLRKLGLITLRSGTVALHDIARLNALASFFPKAPASHHAQKALVGAVADSCTAKRAPVADGSASRTCQLRIENPA